MPNKMLIDASHQEETRVVVVRGNRIEEFDFESQDKKQLRGNIYLARVTRVEPSLQAAFVEYGGNRHGFLAFSEIHPDYYQIPVADRQELLRAEAEAAAADDDDGDDENGRGRKRRRGKGRGSRDQSEKAASAEGDDTVSEDADDDGETDNGHDDGHDNGNGSDDDEVENVGAEDALEEAQTRRKPQRKHYKIQEVIKRRQILLVQVVKEERGNKGAALTTYLSLAGRYSVLMPNTARGGGISRKITAIQDRKRLKDIVKDLEVPQGMGVILRTAGQTRTKAEIKRDYEYLMRMWETVRNLTLESSAPALVYEEGSLIKRSVRDLYNKDIEAIMVAGEEGYREAKDFMRLLMPSHAKMVQPYRDKVPIFARNGIEAQLDKMLHPQVTLKSGGYIIINQTEALVAIDVNSGRSTKEHSIEDTALQTNLEAAEEVARQLRLRDLAGLIVIDFIDMEENRNNRAVEKKLKDCLKNDRARIQVGRISHFGLLEMSRQRIRASVLESTMQPCPHCGGTGHIRSESSVALLVIRAIEEYLLKDARNDIIVHTPASTALYILNHKRSTLVELEARFGPSITIEADDGVGGQHYVIHKGEISTRVVVDTPSWVDEIEEEPFVAEEEPEDDDVESEVQAADESQPEADREDGQSRKRRRRRRRRGGRDRDDQPSEARQVADAAGDLDNGTLADEDDDDGDDAEQAEQASADGQDDGDKPRKRRRGRRGGRRNRRDQDAQAAVEGQDSPSGDDDGVSGEDAVHEVTGEADTAQDFSAQRAVEETALPDPTPAAEGALAEPEAEEKPKRKRTSRRKKTDDEAAPAEAVTAEANTEVVQAAPEAEEKPKRKRAPRRKKVEPEAEQDAGAPAEAVSEPAPEADQTPEPAVQPAPEPEPEAAPEPAQKAPPEPVVVSGDTEEPVEPEKRRSGWWQRRSLF
ncbi:Rne/Rng family ribonuclease [Chelativorans sp. ZYF759]|uniref:Rne/Rng family ribonuclease n=1 Tax=Chelativorans sp. ZYF759 TaxID=2692213 RepID=UPI00145DB9A9|nr:ribonuclease E/G [Chelativorans sp. ZYF759]NMG39958.1 Rne/Rng family ribonuclease [Chelativorans sp. ZYF759]